LNKILQAPVDAINTKTLSDLQNTCLLYQYNNTTGNIMQYELASILTHNSCTNC